ncbi:polymeric immunoglobulin receptor-like [Labrus bergylta]|uniref:polymeric immunoglobulin receptor-like n=1 Tax=Labrus bergylta TaxID=56723 RepID=UPI003313E605
MVIDIKMKTLCLILLFHGSLQLQCNKKQITAHIGGDFILSCEYDATHYLFSKKYWCRGESRRTCVILLDSEGRAKTERTHRSLIVDAGRKGLFVKVTKLQFDDAGVYWVGIDKMNADVMFSVKVVVTEVPVSKPRLWPLSPLLNRPTCWGQPVTVRCGCEQGTAIRYTWFHKKAVLQLSQDLRLHCGSVKKDSGDYYCIASNEVSSQRSDGLSVQVVVPADSDCIYVINMQGQPVYDCADRMTTTTISTTTPAPTPTTNPPSTPLLTSTTCQPITKIHFEATNQSLPFNQTEQKWFLCRALMGFPLWYTLLRWIIFASLLVFLHIFYVCITLRQTKAKRKRRVRIKHLAQ